MLRCSWFLQADTAQCQQKPCHIRPFRNLLFQIVLGTLMAGAAFANRSMEHFGLAIFWLALRKRLQNLAGRFPIAKCFLPRRLHTECAMFDFAQQRHNFLLQQMPSLILLVEAKFRFLAIAGVRLFHCGRGLRQLLVQMIIGQNEIDGHIVRAATNVGLFAQQTEARQRCDNRI